MDNWPNIRATRRAVADSDSGAESAGESLARDLVAELGIGRPWTQVPILVDGRIYWVDLLVGRHAFEFDGKVKYLGRDRGGVDGRRPDDIVWEEKKRQDKICGQGLGMSRIVWDDFWSAARARALVRLAEEYAVTEQRFGARLPEHLERFARKHRGRRVPGV
jgi:hypothetical protein